MLSWFNASRRRAALAVGLAATIFSAGCTAVTGGSSSETVLIGADLELSGEGAALGTIYHNALQLRVEQVNELGLLGNRRLELVVRDNRSDRATSASNLAELSANRSVAALVTGGYTEGLLASIDTIDEARIPTVSLAAPTAVTAPLEERYYIFKIAPNAADTAATLAAELTRLGVGSIAVAATDDRYGQDGAQEMQDAADRAGIEVVIREKIVPGDDAAQLTAAQRIVDFAPDAVVVWSFAPSASEFGKRLRDVGHPGRGLFFDAAAADDLFLGGPSGPALSGATLVFTETLVIDEVIATSPAKAERKTWFRDYTARYGTYHAFASFAADAIGLIVAAVNRLDASDRDALRTAIETTQMDGLSGPIRMTPDNHSGLAPQALTTLVAQGDRWRLNG